LIRTFRALSVLILIWPALVSCGYKSPSTQNKSGLKFRAFVSNPLHPLPSGGGTPVLEIVDASKDVLSSSPISLSGSLSDAGMMAVSPKKDLTLVFSAANNALAAVNNASESPSGSVSLPGATDSFFVWTDNTTAFVAVPTAAEPGQLAGEVGRIGLSGGGITANIPVPGAHFLAPSPSGNQILVLSDTANAVQVLFPSLIDTGNAVTVVSGGSFDRPVWATFSSDGSTAYVLNCGQECGGVGATGSVMTIDMTQSTPIVTNTLSVPGGATVGLLQGSTLYVAGTPLAPLNDCTGSGQTTTATSCGRLSVIDSSSLTITNTTPLVIADGRHDRMTMGSQGQLFVGSRNCTNISTTEIRGCLTIVNTVGSLSNGSVTVAQRNGDVTGIEPVPNRNVVYVCEGGKLTIYDTTTDQPQTTQVNIVGQAVDVKVVDF
jgi:hypothetical protein